MVLETVGGPQLHNSLPKKEAVTHPFQCVLSTRGRNVWPMWCRV